MNEYNRIVELNSKFNNLLKTVAINNGQFSSIDRDLATEYIREIYECLLALESLKVMHPQLSTELEPLRESHSEERNPYSPIDQSVEADAGNKDQHLKDDQDINEEIPIQSEKIAEEISHKELMTEVVNQVPDMGLKKSISELHAERDQKKGTLNDKYNNRGTVIADQLKQTPIKDLKSYIGLNKRFNFISSLFNGSEMEYDEAITRVNSFSNYEQAIQFIQQELMNKHEWKEDDPIVAEFFNLVMRRYLN
ncbi:MAG: hypothetical protein H0V61_02000 [Chitinophagales bacterium]|nr:hypothetical protein [Chitinophagales bacterium]